MRRKFEARPHGHRAGLKRCLQEAAPRSGRFLRRHKSPKGCWLALGSCASPVPLVQFKAPKAASTNRASSVRFPVLAEHRARLGDYTARGKRYSDAQKSSLEQSALRSRRTSQLRLKTRCYTCLTSTWHLARARDINAARHRHHHRVLSSSLSSPSSSVMIFSLMSTAYYLPYIIGHHNLPSLCPNLKVLDGQTSYPRKRTYTRCAKHAPLWERLAYIKSVELCVETRGSLGPNTIQRGASIIRSQLLWSRADPPPPPIKGSRNIKPREATRPPRTSQFNALARSSIHIWVSAILALNITTC